MNKVEIMYRQYKEGAITGEQLVHNLWSILCASDKTEIIYENDDEIIHLRKQKSLNRDITNYIFNIQLHDCTMIGNIKINLDFGSLLS